MKKKQPDFEGMMEELPSTDKKKKEKYTYDTPNRKKAISLTINKEVLDKLKRVSFYTRKTQSEIVDTILSRYFEEKEYPPIPGKKEYDI